MAGNLTVAEMTRRFRVLENQSMQLVEAYQALSVRVEGLETAVHGPVSGVSKQEDWGVRISADTGEPYPGHETHTLPDNEGENNG